MAWLCRINPSQLHLWETPQNRRSWLVHNPMVKMSLNCNHTQLTFSWNTKGQIHLKGCLSAENIWKFFRHGKDKSQRTRRFYWVCWQTLLQSVLPDFERDLGTEGTVRHVRGLSEESEHFRCPVPTRIQTHLRISFPLLSPCSLDSHLTPA